MSISSKTEASSQEVEFPATPPSIASENTPLTHKPNHLPILPKATTSPPSIPNLTTTNYTPSTQSRPLLKPSRKTPPPILAELPSSDQSNPSIEINNSPSSPSISLSENSQAVSSQADVKYLAAGVYESGSLLANRYMIETQIGN